MMTSNPHNRFDDPALGYLSKVSVAMQNPVEVPTVRMWLEKAHAHGLDARQIYDAAVKIRPPHWAPAPSFSEVAPGTSLD